MHATAVVPEPIKGSKTMSPSLLLACIRYLNKSTGFCVGWMSRSPHGKRKTLFLQKRLNVAFGLRPNTQHSMPLSHIYWPNIGAGFVFSQITRRGLNPCCTIVRRISLTCSVPQNIYIEPRVLSQRVFVSSFKSKVTTSAAPLS